MLVLQDLLLRDILRVEIHNVVVDARSQKSRLRVILTKGSAFNSYTTSKSAEQTILSLFIDNNEIPFHQLRLWIKENFEKSSFSKKVYSDLNNAGYCKYRIILDSKAKENKKLISKSLKQLRSTLTSKPKLTAQDLQTIDFLKSHILLLPKNELKILSKKLTNNHHRIFSQGTLQTLISKPFEQAVKSIFVIRSGGRSSGNNGPFGLGNEGLGGMV